MLRDQVAQLTGQLQLALARIAELEQRKPEPPAFVKPNRPAREPKGPRKKRALEHNTSRNGRNRRGLCGMYWSAARTVTTDSAARASTTARSDRVTPATAGGSH